MPGTCLLQKRAEGAGQEWDGQVGGVSARLMVLPQVRSPSALWVSFSLELTCSFLPERLSSHQEEGSSLYVMTLTEKQNYKE